jgi:hypothetical protein
MRIRFVVSRAHSGVCSELSRWWPPADWAKVACDKTRHGAERIVRENCSWYSVRTAVVSISHCRTCAWCSRNNETHECTHNVAKVPNHSHFRAVNDIYRFHPAPSILYMTRPAQKGRKGDNLPQAPPRQGPPTDHVFIPVPNMYCNLAG